MKKTVSVNLMIIFSVLFAFANTNEKAMEYMMFNLNNRAKKLLLNNLKTDKNNAETNFYLGEVYFGENKPDSALFYYKQGQNVNPDYWQNGVGEGKALLKQNATSAEKKLAEISGKNKKSVEVQTAVARSYFENQKLTEARKYIAEAKKLNDKYAPLIELEGDIMSAEKDYGKACGLYEQAIYFDSKYESPYVKYASVYSTINPNASVAMLQQMLDANPQQFLAYREMGEVYYKNGQFSNAVQAYKKYIENDSSSMEDYPKYATILFYGADFTNSTKIVEQALKSDPSNFVLNRLLMYNCYEQKKYAEGASVGDKLMKKNGNDFIALDYIYYARLLAENKRNAEAIAEYEKALQLDSDRATVYKELAEMYDAQSNYEKAIENYKIFFEKGGNQVKTTDHYLFGRAYYSAATDENLTDEEKKKAYSLEADNLFKYVAEKAPDSYLGNFWRARINVVLDPETEAGLSKPYYESAVNLLDKNNPKDAKPLVECYSYLGYYHYLKNNIPESKKFWNMILEIDPKNERAIEALKGL